MLSHFFPCYKGQLIYGTGRSPSLEFGHFPMTAERSLEFGHFPQTAERSNRIAQAAVAEAMAPLVLRYVTPKSQPRRRLCEVGRFSPG